jgi:hypothetical protein
MIYEDYEASTIALENNLLKMTSNIYEMDKNCSFDLCFKDKRVDGPFISREILYGNIIIHIQTIHIMREPANNPPGFENKDWQKYEEMNKVFFQEYSRAFEEHLLNCPL